MPVLQRVKKPTTRKGKKVLLSREPQVIEHVKQTFFGKGHNASQKVVDFFKDLDKLKRPDSVFLSRKNDFVPFEDVTPLEEFSRKKEAAFFGIGTSTKKRPHNVIFGRTFDHQLLDMFEFGLEDYKPIKDFKCEKICSGIKPCIIFIGEAFEQTDEMIRMRNFFTDFFHREEVKAISLQGLEHALVFTAHDNKIFLRSYRCMAHNVFPPNTVKGRTLMYSLRQASSVRRVLERILLKKSGQKTPRIELNEIGPAATLVARRNKIASASLFKDACKTPKELKIKKTKNIEKNSLGTTHGRIHVPKQNVEALQTRKMKGLKKTPEEKKEQRANRKRKKAQSEDEAMDQDE